jgi:putative membrane protein
VKTRLDGFFVFVKGFLMGICDLIPGISGGTMALITGIYERLINVVKSFTPQLFYSWLKILFKGDFKALYEDFRRVDLFFFLVLILGVFSAVFSLSRVITYLLNNHLVLTLSFFIGLIVASTLVIFNYTEKHGAFNISFSGIGFIVGLSLYFVIPIDVEVNILYLVLSGFIGVSAMFLPGISGSFILLILGSYDEVVAAVSALNFAILFPFFIGMVLGVLVFPKVIAFLFAKDKSKTLYFLLGLVIGSLSIPLRRTSEEFTGDFIGPIILFILGFIIVLLLNIFGLQKRAGIDESKLTIDQIDNENL